MLNLLLKIVCSFDERQQRLQWRWRLLPLLLLLFFHSHALYLFHSVKYLLFPCAIFCWHMHTYIPTLEFIEWRDCNYSIRLLLLFLCFFHSLSLYNTQNDCYWLVFFVLLFCHLLTTAEILNMILRLEQTESTQSNINIHVCQILKNGMNCKFRFSCCRRCHHSLPSPDVHVKCICHDNAFKLRPREIIANKFRFHSDIVHTHAHTAHNDGMFQEQCRFAFKMPSIYSHPLSFHTLIPHNKSNWQ